MPSHVKLTHDQKGCHLPTIFWQTLPSSKIAISSNPNPYELDTTKEGDLYFILSDNGNHNIYVKVRHCRFVDFVNDVIDCGCLRCIFCFRIKERERYILYQLLFYNIHRFYFLFFYFSLLQLNNYNEYVCVIYNCCFLWWTYY